jgi:hypothetical protein
MSNPLNASIERSLLEGGDEDVSLDRGSESI